MDRNCYPIPLHTAYIAYYLFQVRIASSRKKEAITISNIMVFQISKVSDQDFPELVTAEWESFETPFQGVLRLFFPILDDDRAASLHHSTDAQLDEYHKEQPLVTWVKVVDTEANNKIAGAAKWYFYTDGMPAHFDEAETMVADWYPEGVKRDFATMAVRQFERPRALMARRPHAFLHIAFTRPEYRHRGVGHLFMKWGLEQADALGLETWLDASEYGAPLYERHGFRRILLNTLAPRPADALSEKEREEWAECEREILPISATVMWRPPYGEYVDGVTVRPWEAELRN